MPVENKGPDRPTPEVPGAGGAGGVLKRHTWKWAAAATAAVLLVGWFVYAQVSAHAFDWRLFLASLSGVRPGWVALSVALIYLTYLIRALRWAVLMRPVQPRLRLRNLLSATVVGFTAITLFGRPGEIVRPYLIATKEKVPLTSQLAAWFLERIYDLLMAILVFGFALARVTVSGMQAGDALTWVLSAGGKIVTVIGGILIIILLLFRHFAEPMRRRLMDALGFLPERHFERVEKLVTAFVQGVESTRSDAALLALIVYSLLEWVLIAACYWCVARAFVGTVHFSLVDVLIYMGFVTFGSAIQIPGIGGGMQVVSVVVLTELFGWRFEVATGFSLFIWFITFVAIVPVGLLEGLREGLNWHNLRQIGREVTP